jgi:N-sulfoglucosamine sulfohydrolase
MGAPGVMLLIADDWSPLAKCYGDAVIRTPNVDAFAEYAVRFDHAFCTTPSCAASRATILTGLQSHTHGQYGHCHGRHSFRVLPEIPTLPQVLQENHIASAAIGKQHIFPPQQFPWSYEAPIASSEEMRDSAKTFLDSVKGESFYLHVGFPQPHRAGSGFGNPNGAKYDPGTIPVPDFLPDVPETREELADYYTAISRLDDGFGLMLELLQQSGRMNDTLVIIMSDHGMPFPGAKGSSFDSGHKCPLLIRSPQSKNSGHANNALVNWTDIMPTVLDWLNIENAPPSHGTSLLPILDLTNSPDREETFLSHSFHEVTNYYPYRILRNRQWKYVLNLFPELTLPLPADLFASKTWRAVEERKLTHLGKRAVGDVLHQPAEKLYDIQNDPHETTNLADLPEHAEVLKMMRAQVQQWREETSDLWLISDRQTHLREMGR